MADLIEFLGTLNSTKRWCVGDVSSLIDKPAADIYQATPNPGMWCVVLAYTNLPVAKNVLVTAIHNVAATLEDSELKTKMLAFNTSMTVQELRDLMGWAGPKSGIGSPPSPADPSKALYSALFTAAKMLKTEAPEWMMRAVDGLVRYKMSSEEKTKAQAITEFYEFLYGEVDLSTWMGSYT